MKMLNKLSSLQKKPRGTGRGLTAEEGWAAVEAYRRGVSIREIKAASGADNLYQQIGTWALKYAAQPEDAK